MERLSTPTRFAFVAVACGLVLVAPEARVHGQMTDDALRPEDKVPPPATRTRALDPARVPTYRPEWHPPDLPPLAKPPAWAFDDPFLRGFALGLHGDLPDLPYSRLFAEIKGLGGTHVSLVLGWNQATVRAVTLRPSPSQTPSDEEVKKVIGQARAAGLEVLLFPIVHIDRTRSGEWRGRLEPAIPERWWASYREFVCHYAELAQSEGVSVLSVGSELLQQESERDQWVRVVADVRKLYSGKLTYSANWDHFDVVGFWDQLDYAGITGYFELSYEREPSLAALRKTWVDAAEVIATYQDRAKIPLLITEVGYPSQIGSAAHPWDYTRTRAYSAEAQYVAFRAMYEAWLLRSVQVGESGNLGIGGFFVWNWYGYGGPDDIGYTPRGKPASAIFERWFSGH